MLDNLSVPNKDILNNEFAVYHNIFFKNFNLYAIQYWLCQSISCSILYVIYIKLRFYSAICYFKIHKKIDI